MTQGCTFREPLLLQCPLICFPMHARERNPVPLYPRQTKPRRWMQGPSSNHTLPLLGADFSTLHLADFPMENHTWSPGKHRLVCYKQGLDRKLSQQLTLNPPPTSPRTFSMGTLVFSKWTSQAETHDIECLKYKPLCTWSAGMKFIFIHSFYIYQ